MEGHEVVLKTSSEKTSADDQDYLQLLEAHQQRLEEDTGTNGTLEITPTFQINKIVKRGEYYLIVNLESY